MIVIVWTMKSSDISSFVDNWLREVKTKPWLGIVLSENGWGHGGSIVKQKSINLFGIFVQKALLIIKNLDYNNQ